MGGRLSGAEEREMLGKRSHQFQKRVLGSLCYMLTVGKENGARLMDVE